MLNDTIERGSHVIFKVINDSTYDKEYRKHNLRTCGYLFFGDNFRTTYIV